MKVLSVFGTRPEAIKMAPVIKRLQEHPDIVSQVCVTGQHREMLDQVLSLFDVQTDYDLNIMRANQCLSYVTVQALVAVERVIESEQPDWLLVQGDTTTMMAASLAAFYQRVPVGHMEAGLRTNDKRHPFPEEINRRMVSVIADLHFAPTEGARRNLLAENVRAERIVVTGNSVIDALHWVAGLSYNPDTGPLSDIPWHQRIILVTAHRRESFGKPLESMCQALLEIAARYKNDIHIVFPVHLNPNVQEPVYRMLDGVPNITLLSPLDYQSFIWTATRSYLILTDSGGIQEEASSLGVPVLVLRELTERPEVVEAGMAIVVGANTEAIVCETIHLLDDEPSHHRMTQSVNLYGDGHASGRIVEALLRMGTLQ